MSTYDGELKSVSNTMQITVHLFFKIIIIMFFSQASVAIHATITLKLWHKLDFQPRVCTFEVLHMYKDYTKGRQHGSKQMSKEAF